MEDKVTKGLQQMGFEVTPHQVDQFIKFYHHLVEWNKKMNLTTITEPEEVLTRHFLDSVSCATSQHFAGCHTLLDVGTGAGFPGIPLKIMYPEKTFTLMDSLAKRIRFLEEGVTLLGLQKVTLVHARAEEAARLPAYREGFQGIVSRAVASLPVLLEYTIPFLQVEGWFFCQKGPAWKEELEEAKHATEVLCVTLEEVIPVTIPYDTLHHHLLVFRKTKKTPEQYPRKPGTPGRKPL